jgi:cupin 2 domain-containing protein
MNSKVKNIFTALPEDLTLEVFETLLSNDNIKLERIVSKGNSSPKDFWYDQDENEWVLILKGSACIKFFDPVKEVVLKTGDYLHIPAQVKHRVEWTSPNEETIWLALFY